MRLFLTCAALMIPLMANACEKGSSVMSDPEAYCKTHHQTQEACEQDDRCSWNEDVCKEK